MRKSITSILPRSAGRDAANPHNEQLPLNLALLLACYEEDAHASPLVYAEGALNVRPDAEVCAQTRAPAAHRNILLVEDDQVMARALTRDLELDGFNVTIAETCADALQLAVAFDSVIVDLDLPDGNGLELGEQLKANTPGLVFYSGVADPSLLKAARELAPLVTKNDGAERLREELRRRRSELL